MSKLQVGDIVCMKDRQPYGYMRVRARLGKRNGREVIQVEHDPSSLNFDFGLIKEFYSSQLQVDKRAECIAYRVVKEKEAC